jgi:phage terminase Nu1 subunit (DNA packaging protein)
MPTDIFTPIPRLRGERVTKAQLSAFTGETLDTLDGWVRRGCPCERTGGVRSPLIFDIAQVLAWRAITACDDPMAAKLVRASFERDALEAELERARA